MNSWPPNTPKNHQTAHVFFSFSVSSRTLRPPPSPRLAGVFFFVSLCPHPELINHELTALYLYLSLCTYNYFPVCPSKHTRAHTKTKQLIGDCLVDLARANHSLVSFHFVLLCVLLVSRARVVVGCCTLFLFVSANLFVHHHPKPFESAKTKTLESVAVSVNRAHNAP